MCVRKKARKTREEKKRSWACYIDTLSKMCLIADASREKPMSLVSVFLSASGRLVNGVNWEKDRRRKLRCWNRRWLGFLLLFSLFSALWLRPAVSLMAFHFSRLWKNKCQPALARQTANTHTHSKGEGIDGQPSAWLMRHNESAS